MIPYSFHPEARVEYAAAALYHASRRRGLGASFADAVEQALSLIREYPELGSPVEGSVRRWHLTAPRRGSGYLTSYSRAVVSERVLHDDRPIRFVVGQRRRSARTSCLP